MLKFKALYKLTAREDNTSNNYTLKAIEAPLIVFENRLNC